MNKLIRNNQRGYVMVLVLIGAMVISATMFSTIFVSTKSQKVVKNFKESVQTLNAADTGIKMAKTSIRTWLTNQQATDVGGSGSEVDFDTILSQSATAGYLVVPSDSTDFSSMDLFGNEVVVTAWDEEGSTDSDRIIVIQAEATSSTNQRVQIQSYIQAPSEDNTTGLPGMQGSLGMCADVAGLSQELTVTNNAVMTGEDFVSLPGIGCSGAGCHGATATGGGIPSVVMYDTGNQTVNISGGAVTVEGYDSGGTLQTGVASIETAPLGDCTDLYNLVNQLSVLSGSLPNVNIVTGNTVTSSDLGTTADPKITIVKGAATSTSKSKGKKAKSSSTPPVTTVSIANNTQGAGILLLQAATTTTLDISGGTNFYYEGLIIVYGDETTTFDTVGTEAMYGGLIVLTGSNDPAHSQRVIFDNKAAMYYSTEGLATAEASMGSTSSTIVSVDDFRNSVVTVGWFEDYDF